MSRLLENEIAVTVPEGLSEDALKEKYPLWYYLKENIGNPDTAKQWPQYDKRRDDAKASAYRYFDASAVSGETGDLQDKAKELLSETEILMYWENENAASSKPRHDETVLTVEVTCNSGKEATTIVTRYRLKISETTSQWRWEKAKEGV